MIINGQDIDLKDLVGNSETEIKRLGPEDSQQYLKRLTKRISDISHVFQQISTPDFSHDCVLPVIAVLKESLETLAIKHSVSEQDQLDFSLTIDPSDSGFPTVKDFYYLHLDKERAPSIIEEQFPSREKLVDKIRQGILAGREVEHEQILLKRAKYFQQISSIEIFPSMGVVSGEPQFKGRTNGKRNYVLDWWFLEGGTNVPVFYRMLFMQDANYPPLHEGDEAQKARNPALDFFLQQSRRGILDLRNFVWRLDQGIDEIHPKSIRKYTIGPYYDSQTLNSPEMQKAFEGVENPSALRFSVEMVLSIDVTQKPAKYFMDKVKSFFTGKVIQKEVYSDIKLMESGLIVPMRIKQKFERGCDEYGQPCNVYGMSENGGHE